MPSPSNAIWPTDLMARAKALYESGEFSCAQISKMIGNGKTRNAVIGMARRAKWLNPNPQKGGTRPGEKRPRAAKGWSRKSANSIFGNLSRVDPGEAALPKQITPPEFLGIPLMELGEYQCHFIPGNDRLYCGQPTDGISPYCDFCKLIMYQPHATRYGPMKLPPMNGRR